jgi:hypothetical protein
MLEIHKVTISRDISYLREQSKKNIKEHISDKLPLEYNKCVSGLEEIIKESWIIIAHSEKIGNTKDKLQSLALIKDTYNTKMDLLTNASLLQDSIKFVTETREKLPTSSIEDNGDKERLGKFLPNRKEKENGIQGSTEDYITESEQQYNQVF